MKGREKLSISHQKLIQDINEFGLHVIHVLEDETGPGFSYSVGLYHTLKQPEVIIIGLNRELCHSIINEIDERVKKGENFKSGEYYSGLIEGFDCYFVDVNKKYLEEYVGQALWFYEDSDFPLLQCIYPTTTGIYPWQTDWPESLKNLQPVLGEIK